MRVGRHEVYWHRPLVAYQPAGGTDPVVDVYDSRGNRTAQTDERAHIRNHRRDRLLLGNQRAEADRPAGSRVVGERTQVQHRSPPVPAQQSRRGLGPRQSGGAYPGSDERPGQSREHGDDDDRPDRTQARPVAWLHPWNEREHDSEHNKDDDDGD